MTTIRLHARQSEAFLSPATELLFGGAAGGGKSFLLRVAAIAWSLAVPGLQVYMFRRVSNDLVRNHMEGPTSFPALLETFAAAGRVKINRSDNTLEFRNRSKIFLCHCRHEQDMYKYQGAEIHALLIDELTHFTAGVYRYLRGRVRMAGVEAPRAYRGLFPRVLCASNPGGVGHAWVKAMFIDNAASGEIRAMPEKDGGMTRQYIPARLEDNPSLAEADPDYAARLAALGDPALVRAMLEGDWDIVSGGALDDIWKRETHVLKPFAIPAFWRLDRSFDWGSSRPFSVGWWAESDGSERANGPARHFPRGTLFRVAEYYGWTGIPDQGVRMTAFDLAKAVLAREKELFPGRAVHPGPADSAIYAVENGRSIAEDMEKTGVVWTRADKRPGSRKSGLEALRAALAASRESPMERPGLFVFDTCRQFIRTVPALPRDSADPDDVDSRAEDHIYDEPRYRVMAPRRFIRPD